MIGMLVIPFVHVAAAYTVLYLLVRAVVSIRSRRIDWKREKLHILMYINLLVIFSLTFSPLVLDTHRIFDFRVNFIPFLFLTDYDNSTHMFLNVAGNILMFVPTGILLPVLFKRLDKAYKVAGTGFLISLAIEILQLPFADRASDVDDLLMNTFGAIIGYVLFRFARSFLHAKKQSTNEICKI